LFFSVGLPHNLIYFNINYLNSVWSQASFMPDTHMSTVQCFMTASPLYARRENRVLGPVYTRTLAGEN